MNKDLNSIKTDVYGKTELYNRTAEGYDSLSPELERSELYPFIDSVIFPIDNDPRADFVHGIEFTADVLIDTAVFTWQGACTYQCEREESFPDDIFRFDRERTSMGISEAVILEASNELFGISLVEEFWNQAKYCDRRRLVHSKKIRVFISGLSYKIVYGDRFVEEEDY